MDKRKQLIRSLADQMARSYYPGDPDEDPEAFEGAVLHKMKFAHIAVARTEEIARAAFAAGYIVADGESFSDAEENFFKEIGLLLPGMEDRQHE